jgi:orotidine-5'-phosphate decarboxylase
LDLKEFHKIFKTTWILAPGVGAQGGEIEDVLAIRDEDGLGVLIPVSRGILYAGNGDDYLAKAKEAVQALWEAQKM